MTASKAFRRGEWLLAIFMTLITLLPQGAFAAAANTSIDVLASEIDAYVEEHLDTTAGVAVAVVNGQEIALERYYGFADISQEKSVDQETVFEWGSASKLLVWTSVMQLVERGELDLTADINTYLPENFLKRLAYNDPITMMNLMHHDAGWDDVLVGLFVRPEAYDGASLEDTLRQLEPLQNRRPGQSTGYSNYGVALAGYIVERISEQPFYDYVSEHIFEPLGMSRTSIHPTLSDNQWVKERRPLTQGYAGLTPAVNLFVIPLYPAGMATGTLGDFARFAQALLSGDGQSPLFTNKETSDTMFSASLFYGDSGLARNSHGFWVQQYGSPVLAHAGNTAAFSAHLLIQPETDTGLIIMTNQANETVYNSGLPELIFGKFDPATVPGDIADMRKYTGIYQSSRSIHRGFSQLYNLMMTIPLFSATEDTLRSIPGNDFYALEQVAPHILIEGEKNSLKMVDFLYLDLDAAGEAPRLSMNYMDFVRIPTWKGLLPYIMLALFAFAVLFSVIALLIRCIRPIAGKGGGSTFAWPVIVMQVMTVLAGVNLVWLAVDLLQFATASMMRVHLMFNIAFVAVAALYVLILVLNYRRNTVPRAKKRMAVVTAVMAVFVSVAILLLELYRF